MLYRDAHMTGWAYKDITQDDLRFPLVYGEGKRSRLLATIGNNIIILSYSGFSVTRILREINFRECRSSKSAIYNNFRGYQL